MIEIKITDPHLMDKNALQKTATYLLAMAGFGLAEMPQGFKPSTPIAAPAPAPVANIPPPPPLLPHSEPASLNINPFAKPVEVPVAPILEAPKALSAPVVPRPVNPGVELDVRGLPWDNRIHSRTKSKTVDGQWKAMRGITPETLKAVEAELFQAVQAPSIGEAPVAAVPVPPAPIAPIAPVATPIAPIAPIPDPIIAPQNDFPALMNKITSNVNSGKIQSAAVIKIIQEFGLPSLPVVATRPDLIPSISARLDALLAGGA